MGRLDNLKTFSHQGFAEFKTFIQRGNVIDLAVAVIIGAAFGKIVTSLVTDIISPPIALTTSEIYGLFADKIDVTETNHPVLFHLGRFLQSIVDFLIVAFCVFLLVKGVTALQKRFIADEPKPADMTTQEKLLAEIRDLLKAQQDARAMEAKKEEPPAAFPNPNKALTTDH